MDKIDIIICRYIANEASEKDLEILLKWVNISEENKVYFCELKRAATVVNIHSKGDEINNEFDSFSDLLESVEKKSKESYSTKFIAVWSKIAAVLFLPLLISIVFMYTSYDMFVPKVLSDVVYKELFTPEGVRAKLKLDDGTMVWLNSNSKIKYSNCFGGKDRCVELIGEAFFKVTHDETKPFIVKANDLRIKVMGTSFNVNSYKKNVIETSLKEGRIELISGVSSKKLILKPGYMAVYNREDGSMPVEKVNPKRIAGWRDGKILFFDTPMRDVISTLEQWYDVTIVIKDDSIYNYRFTASIKDKTLPELLQLLRVSSPIGYKINGKKVFIYKMN